MRVPSGEPELVRAGAAGDPAALAALWDVFAFCQRVLGGADAAQDAFLLAHAELGRLARSGESFGGAVFQAARATCYDLLARDRAGRGARRGPASSLSAAASRLRPQQRAALALKGLEGLRYAEIAAVLGIGTEAVGALLARARLRLHDELRGTALAGAAVRSPDCEDVLALLGAILLAVAFSALALTVSGSLTQRDPLSGGVRLPDAARSLRLAGVPAALPGPVLPALRGHRPSGRPGMMRA